MIKKRKTLQDLTITDESDQEQSKKYLEALEVRHFYLFTYKVPDKSDGD